MYKSVVLSTIGALGLLYGIKKLSKSNHTRNNTRNTRNNTRNTRNNTRNSRNNSLNNSLNNSRNNIRKKSVAFKIEPANVSNIKLLFWNIYWKSFETNEQTEGINIIKTIHECNPDIMVLSESSVLIPEIGNASWYNKIKLSNYKTNHIYSGKKNQDGIIIYWNNKFKKIAQTKGYSIRKNPTTHIEEMVQSINDHVSIGIKLRYFNKIINVIGLHLGHDLTDTFIIKSLEIIAAELEIQEGEDLIIGGDFNEFHTYKLESITIANNVLNIYNTRDLIDTRNNSPIDLIYSNIHGINVSSKNTADSDHLPLIATIPYGIITPKTYLVSNGNKWIEATIEQYKVSQTINDLNTDITFDRRKGYDNLTVNNKNYNIIYDEIRTKIKLQADNRFKYIMTLGNILQEAVQTKSKTGLVKVGEDKYILCDSCNTSNSNIINLPIIKIDV